MSYTNPTAQLRDIVQARISSFGIDCYTDEAPDNATYPYCVYSLNSSGYEDKRTDIILDCDIWDEFPNYQRIEAFADTLEDAFDNYSFCDDSIQVLPHFFKYTRNKVPDPDRTIKRINIKFQIQNYKH